MAHVAWLCIAHFSYGGTFRSHRNHMLLAQMLSLLVTLLSGYASAQGTMPSIGSANIFP
jgi:hypothetical protein